MNDPKVLLHAVHGELAAVEPQIQTIRPEGPDRKRLADAVEAAIGHTALGTEAGCEAAIADLTGAAGVIAGFRNDARHLNARAVARAADKALPELRAIVWPVTPPSSVSVAQGFDAVALGRTGQVMRKVVVSRSGDTGGVLAVPVSVTGLPPGTVVGILPAVFLAGDGTAEATVMFAAWSSLGAAAAPVLNGRCALAPPAGVVLGAVPAFDFTLVPPPTDEGLAPAIPVPAVADVIQTTAAGLASAYASAGPGKTILVAPGGTFPGDLTLGRSGTAAQPIVIRVGTLVGGGIVDPPVFPAATITGKLTFSGDHNTLRGFTVGGFLVDKGTNGNRLNRCKLTRQTDDHGVDTWLDWCEWTGMAGVCHQTDPTQGTLRPKVYRCHFHDDVGTVPPNRVFMQFGNNPASLTSLQGWARDCLFGPNSGGVQQAVEMKSCDNQVIRCAAVAAPGTTLRIHTRVGMRNTIQACWVSNGFIGGRGPGHVYADCVVLAGSKAVGPYGGNITWEDWVAHFNDGTADAGMYPIGKDSRVIRQDHPIIGFTDAGAGHLGPTGTTLEACVLPHTLQNNAETPQILTSTSFPLPPGAAIQWPTSKVGPNGVYDVDD